VYANSTVYVTVTVNLTEVCPPCNSTEDCHDCPDDPDCPPGCEEPNYCCENGWRTTGEPCDTPTCIPECAPHGTCVGVDICNCTDGWTGADCKVPENCTFTPCSPIGGISPYVYYPLVSEPFVAMPKCGDVYSMRIPPPLSPPVLIVPCGAPGTRMPLTPASVVNLYPLPPASVDFTMSFWVLPNVGVPGIGTVLLAFSGLTVVVDTTAGTVMVPPEPPIPIPLQPVYHFALTGKLGVPGTVQLYMDGFPLGPLPTVNVPVGCGDVVVDATVPLWYFSGYLCDDRAYTPPEVGTVFALGRRALIGWPPYDCFGVLCNNESVCGGHGSCAAEDTCDCCGGYTGEECACMPEQITVVKNITVREFEDCAGNCSGHGTCGRTNDGSEVCGCDEGWFGPDCQWNKTDICQNFTGPCDPEIIVVNNTILVIVNNTIVKNVTIDVPGNCTDPEVIMLNETVTILETVYVNGTVLVTVTVNLTEVCPSCPGCPECEEFPICFDIVPWHPGVCSGHGLCHATNTCLCEDGWWGEDCGEGGPDCECQDSCKGGCEWDKCSHEWQFHCKSGWHGYCCNRKTHWCDGIIETRHHDVCGGNGDCVAQDVCQCDDTWTGQWCDEPDCDPSCIHGECVEGNQCSCETGWTGSRCDVPICDPDCVNGFCYEPGECICDQGWKGSKCHKPICVPTCGDHGDCIAPDYCDCDDGWKGDFCDSEHGHCSPEQVNSTACPLGQVCIVINGVPSCWCKGCYHPWTCNGVPADDSETCSGHGDCIAENTCECDEGWKGTVCDQRRPKWCFGYPSTCPGVCSGHGTCCGWDTCACDEGWTGEQCDVPICDPCCGQHGTCVGNDTCVCDPGYFGDQCDQWRCCGLHKNNRNTCGGAGVCWAPGRCRCLMGTFGPCCEDWLCFDQPKDADYVCSYHGECMGEDHCVCGPGYYGEECENPVPECPDPVLVVVNNTVFLVVNDTVVENVTVTCDACPGCPECPPPEVLVVNRTVFVLVNGTVVENVTVPCDECPECANCTNATTTCCAPGYVWDAATEECVMPHCFGLFANQTGVCGYRCEWGGKVTGWSYGVCVDHDECRCVCGHKGPDCMEYMDWEEYEECLEREQ